MHAFIYGLLVGLGAAVPIGPCNIEIMRRTLSFGARYGMAFGMGACFADISYYILAICGLAVLPVKEILIPVGILGIFLLFWFALQSLRMTGNSYEIKKYVRLDTYPPFRHGLEGFGLTLFNPYTIIFWTSTSASISAYLQKSAGSKFHAFLGLCVGTMGWVLSLNGFLHSAKHRISGRVIQLLNLSGGILLFIFALLTLLKLVY